MCRRISKPPSDKVEEDVLAVKSMRCLTESEVGTKYLLRMHSVVTFRQTSLLRQFHTGANTATVTACIKSPPPISLLCLPFLDYFLSHSNQSIVPGFKRLLGDPAGK
jgi:hypothetical protein